MRTRIVVRFLRVSLAAVLATMTCVAGLAYQVPGPPSTGGLQPPGSLRLEADSPVPGTGFASQSPDVTPPPPAARQGIPTQSPANPIPVQRSYSTAWPSLSSTPTRQYGHGGTGSTAANGLLAPTGQAGAARYPTSLGSRGGGSSFTSQAALGAMSGSRPSARRTASSKPFSSYSPKPGVSPYMNLFRTDNFSGIDNYNLYVRPTMRQQQTNRQTRTELNSLRSNSGAHGTQLRDLNQRTDTLQGTSQPGRFGNYLDYYPGLKR